MNESPDGFQACCILISLNLMWNKTSAVTCHQILTRLCRYLLLWQLTRCWRSWLKRHLHCCRSCLCFQQLKETNKHLIRVWMNKLINTQTSVKLPALRDNTDLSCMFSTVRFNRDSDGESVVSPTATLTFEKQKCCWRWKRIEKERLRQCFGKEKLQFQQHCLDFIRGIPEEFSASSSQTSKT